MFTCLHSSSKQSSHLYDSVADVGADDEWSDEKKKREDGKVCCENFVVVIPPRNIFAWSICAPPLRTVQL